MKITRKLKEVLVFRAFGVVLIFGLLFIGCGGYKPDIGEWIDEQLEKARETPTVDAVAEVNKAANLLETKSALETYAKELELDLTHYSMLSDDIKDTAAQSVIAHKPYLDKEAIQTVFNSALQAAATAQKNLSLKFKITPEDSGDKALVEASFNAVHNYIQKAFTVNTTEAQSVIKLGNYIDLKYLNVAGDGGSTNADDGYIHATSGLRLIVIGINSFNGINGNDTPHIVVHFENRPGYYKMNNESDNTTGYLGSAMRGYIVNNFLTGLKNAGVPDEVLWPPSRRVASSGVGTPTAQAIIDKLWLPTSWEMFGENHYSVATCENAGNQVSFTGYYKSETERQKGVWYWLASPYSDHAAYFCDVSDSGYPYFGGASWAGGVVPAFCVR
ncbi:MAG: hypothetical protein Ta2F_16550 [Termitinemataceae bacterium]|nr:MAG: hypothetical protein Ta2F_16550 [Termitinemataceae bacterium]